MMKVTYIKILKKLQLNDESDLQKMKVWSSLINMTLGEGGSRVER